MGITQETRRAAYEESREAAKTRKKQIYKRLQESGPMTADTLMAAMGYMDPNNVRPRLTELKRDGLVRVIDKARNRRGKLVAVWEAVEDGTP